MKKIITVLEGDGIGPEVTAQAVQVLEAIAGRYDHTFRFQYHLMGACAIDQTGDPLPEATLNACRNSDAILLGAIGHPRYDHDPAARVRPEQGLLRLRQALQLYANIRPVQPYPELHHLSPLKKERLRNVDMVIFRELTGGIYFGEKTLAPDQSRATDTCTYHREEIERIARPAFEYARQRRRKLTLVDKANVLETSRLWRKVVQDVAREYPDITVDCLYVDNAAMQLVLNPAQFDVILTENMFGDILSDEASVLCGSLGLLPSASLGEHTALFEPIHGSYPQAAGQDVANPIGSILSAAMMLDHFGLDQEASTVRKAVHASLTYNIVTRDISTADYYRTSVVGEFVCHFIQNGIPGPAKMQNMILSASTII